MALSRADTMELGYRPLNLRRSKVLLTPEEAIWEIPCVVITSAVSADSFENAAGAPSSSAKVFRSV